MRFLVPFLYFVFCFAHAGHHHHHDHNHHHDHSHHHDHDHDHGAADTSVDAHATWGSTISWKSLPEGLAEASATGKPLMLLIWKTWCGACKALRPKFASSVEIANESKNFVMVNTVDDEEPKDALYKPGGAGYIPRVLFFRPDGTLLDVTSGNPQYAYFYGEPEAILDSMKKAWTLVQVNKDAGSEWSSEL